jgi:hypothetical protein
MNGENILFESVLNIYAILFISCHYFKNEQKIITEELYKSVILLEFCHLCPQLDYGDASIHELSYVPFHCLDPPLFQELLKMRMWIVHNFNPI